MKDFWFIVLNCETKLVEEKENNIITITEYNLVLHSFSLKKQKVYY